MGAHGHCNFGLQQPEAHLMDDNSEQTAAAVAAVAAVVATPRR